MTTVTFHHTAETGYSTAREEARKQTNSMVFNTFIFMQARRVPVGGKVERALSLRDLVAETSVGVRGLNGENGGCSEPLTIRAAA